MDEPYDPYADVVFMYVKPAVGEKRSRDSRDPDPARKACVICSDTTQAFPYTCRDGHPYCMDCADPFAKDALGKPAAVLAQAQGIPCSCCPSAVPLDQLPADILRTLASVLSYALHPTPENRPSARVLKALGLFCPGCDAPALPDMVNCIHQTCPSCRKVFCGGCFQLNCHDTHSKRNSIHDKPARLKEQAKVIHRQLLAVFRDLALRDREPALATLSPHLPKPQLHAITKAVRLL